MPSDRDIAQEVRQLLMEAMPPPAPDPASHYPGPSHRERCIRLQIVLYTAITVLCMVVFFYGALSLAGHITFNGSEPVKTDAIDPGRVQDRMFQRIALTEQDYLPVGRIVSPAPNDTTGRTVTITGYTENIPIDTPFIWLVVDVPSIGRCWPKTPTIKPNSAFQATIYEGGGNLEYTVTLYAVGYGLNQIIEHWLEDGIFGGLPMIPQQYRLDSARLVLNSL